MTDAEKIAASLTYNQKATLLGEYMGESFPNFGRPFLPGKWISMHAGAVLDGLIKRGLARRLKETEIDAIRAYRAPRTSSTSFLALTDRGREVAEILAKQKAALNRARGEG
jgi:hypothetical protein